MKKEILVVLLTVVLVSSCASFKGVLRSVPDLVESVCDIFGTEEAAAAFKAGKTTESYTTEKLCTPVDGLDGFSLAEFCAVHKPLSPFIRRILAADKDGCAGYGADVDSLGLGL